MTATPAKVVSVAGAMGGTGPDVAAMSVAAGAMAAGRTAREVMTLQVMVTVVTAVMGAAVTSITSTLRGTVVGVATMPTVARPAVTAIGMDMETATRAAVDMAAGVWRELAATIVGARGAVVVA